MYFVCVGAVDGGVRCAIVFHNRPVSGFDVAQTGNIFGGVATGVATGYCWSSGIEYWVKF